MARGEFNLVLAFARGAHESRQVHCPVCSESLEVASLGDVNVDGCLRGHGLWFDADELATVLNASADGVGILLSPVVLGVQEQAALERVNKEWLEKNAKWESGDTVDALGIVAAAIFGILG